MSIRSIRSHFALSLRAALLATAAASSLTACGTQVESEASAVVSSCQQQSDVLLRQDFSQGAPGWSLVTSQPADPGHDWTVEHGKLRSDPAGRTLPGGYYNRFDSPSFEPMGRGSLRLRLRMAYSVRSNGILQVFVGTRTNPAYRALIADLAGHNPSFPAADDVTIQVPAGFSVKEQVFVSLLVQSGPGGDYGAQIESLEVLSDQSGAVFADDFNDGLGKWSVYSDPGIKGHVWGVQERRDEACEGRKEARSDLAGSTRSDNYTRLESAPFSLVGKDEGEVMVMVRYSLPPQGRYQVFLADMDIDSHRALIGEFSGRNASWPAADGQTFQIPAAFLGRPRVRVAFLELVGDGEARDYGIALDSVRVLAAGPSN